MPKKIKTIVVDTLNGIQNNQYMSLLDKKTMVTRDKWKDFGVEIYNFMIQLQALGFETVLILGYEGTGKSYGIKYLEPETNIWYNADQKNPTFKYVESGDAKVSSRELYGTKVNPSKYMPIPKTYKEIIGHISEVKNGGVLEDEPVAFIIGHVEDYKSDNQIRQRLKTLGALATKMNIEGKVENCLYTYLDTQGEKPIYKLDTMNSGTNTARALEDAFATRYIDNNFQTIYDAIKNY